MLVFDSNMVPSNTFSKCIASYVVALLTTKPVFHAVTLNNISNKYYKNRIRCFLNSRKEKIDGVCKKKITVAKKKSFINCCYWLLFKTCLQDIESNT